MQMLVHVIQRSLHMHVYLLMRVYAKHVHACACAGAQEVAENIEPMTKDFTQNQLLPKANAFFQTLNEQVRLYADVLESQLPSRWQAYYP